MTQLSPDEIESLLRERHHLDAKIGELMKALNWALRSLEPLALASWEPSAPSWDAYRGACTILAKAKQERAERKP